MGLLIDRSVFADLGQPAAIARALLKQIPSLPIPVPIEELALACGIASIDDLCGRLWGLNAGDSPSATNSATF
jgi:hypothetical protein